MSREQWGHGYYRGRAEAFMPEVLRTWALSYDAAGNLCLAGRVVQNFPENHVLLEVWGLPDLIAFVNHGFRPVVEIDMDSLQEVDLPPERSKYFASWDGFIKAIENELALRLEIVKGDQ